MQITIAKLIALAIAVAYVVAAWVLEKHWNYALLVATGTVLPLALIWFPELLGSLPWWGQWQNLKPSPPLLVAGMGWLFLLGVPVLILLTSGLGR
jgi:hypothetical protein